MANEAILKLRQEDPIDFIVEDAVGIEKGAVLKLVNPRTASGATMVPDTAVAGIAAREKIASDGRTRLALFRKGVFDMVASGAVVIGAPVSSAAQGSSDLNKVKTAKATASGAEIIGTALETAADAEVFEVAVNI